MRTSPVRTPQAPSPAWSVHESADQNEEREARISELIARAQKHAAKAPSRDSDAQRIAHLHRMLDDLLRQYELARAAPERARHLADAVRDLRVMILRAESE